MCKGCGFGIHLGKNTLGDFKKGKIMTHNIEFIYKTGYCMSCLVERGYCT